MAINFSANIFEYILKNLAKIALMKGLFEKCRKRMYEVLTALDLLTFSLIKIAKCLEKYISLTILASSVSKTL